MPTIRNSSQATNIGNQGPECGYKCSEMELAALTASKGRCKHEGINGPNGGFIMLKKMCIILSSNGIMKYFMLPWIDYIFNAILYRSLYQLTYFLTQLNNVISFYKAILHSLRYFIVQFQLLNWFLRFHRTIYLWAPSQPNNAVFVKLAYNCTQQGLVTHIFISNLGHRRFW